MLTPHFDTPPGMTLTEDTASPSGHCGPHGELLPLNTGHVDYNPKKIKDPLWDWVSTERLRLTWIQILALSPRCVILGLLVALSYRHALLYTIPSAWIPLLPPWFAWLSMLIIQAAA